MVEEEGKKIFRIGGTDIHGDKRVNSALTKVKGISHMMNNAIIRKAGVLGSKKFEELTDSEINILKKLIEKPEGIPKWMYNRRKDIETGEDKHISSSDLMLVNKMDVRRLQVGKSYRGIRHALGLKLRGQRTKSTGRKGGVVGVKRKSKVKKSGK